MSLTLPFLIKTAAASAVVLAIAAYSLPCDTWKCCTPAVQQAPQESASAD